MFVSNTFNWSLFTLGYYAVIDFGEVLRLKIIKLRLCKSVDRHMLHILGEIYAHYGRDTQHNSMYMVYSEYVVCWFDRKGIWSGTK